MAKPYDRLEVNIHGHDDVLAVLTIYGLNAKEAENNPEAFDEYVSRRISERGFEDKDIKFLSWHEPAYFVPPRSTPHVYVTPKAYEFV